MPNFKIFVKVLTGIPYSGALAYGREKHLLATLCMSVRQSAATKRILVKFYIGKLYKVCRENRK